MSDHPPILFVHGMFMTASSWSEWEKYFSDRGYRTYAPDWPYRRGDPEQLKAAPPEDLPSLRLDAVLDVYRRAIAEMPEPPILVGHSMGGLVVQILLQEGGVRAGIAIDSAPPAGVSTAKWSFLRSNFPVITKRRRPFVPSKSWFTYAFAHTLDDAEVERVWRAHAVPESGQVARDSTSDVARIDPRADRPPLLLVAGELDHIIPVSLSRKNYEFYQGPPTDYREFAGRTHWICGQEGWEEVAAHVESWLEETLFGP
ncbi:MAG: alpha/beta fold hydrolase [Myxococcota bacterium]